MSGPYLSRLRIARNPQVAALAQLLDPEHTGQRMDAHHRLLWSAFSGNPDATRDYLWREEGRGTFLVLSQRPPEPSLFFEPVEPREFSPALKAGDRLAFALRVNATRTVETGRKSIGGKPHKVHIDLVMDALHALPPGERAPERMKAAQQVAEQWLARQGHRHGFHLDEAAVNDYSVRALPGWTAQRKGQPQFGVLDVSGRLSVTDPSAFIAQIVHGFGRAKAFGCGLMLIRRS
ncbi:MAG: type I-E CRISPR-associated protein Cas6/Cse3/CasE [Burkholderiales bacterium]|nr:type I-E CRISPR-associated protein Cas6/Cse3/CasE [Burkholderiales bacterium]MBK8667658.1 type I-E CRISPR-associated protein Cas6/Cse3/CasE [Burkholderiales bacterium]